MPAAQRKTPQDRRPAKAAAKDEPVEFDFAGVHYCIDRKNADDLELYEYVEDEKYIIAIRGFLGRDQWKKFKDANRDPEGRVSAEHFEPFLDAAMKAIGGN